LFCAQHRERGGATPCDSIRAPVQRKEQTMDRDDVRSDFPTTHHDPLSFGLPDKLGRRGFMVTSLAVGFALAARPVRAQAIVTDPEGLTAGEVKVPVADGEIPAYRSMPASGGPF